MHMERKELDFVLKQNHYIEGGTKEACVKVRDFLSHATNPGNQIHSAYKTERRHYMRQQ